MQIEGRGREGGTGVTQNPGSAPGHRRIYRVRQKSNSLRGSFLSSRLEFQSKILPAYLVILYTHKSLVSI